MKVLILHGPNLNLLGKREPEIYGSDSLKDINQKIAHVCKEIKIDYESRQTNSENVLVDWVQCAKEDGFSAIIINPAALSHTSVALRDALANFKGRKVEVHLSNTYKREIFRKKKLISSVCDGVIEGLGYKVYMLALRSLV